MQKSRARGNFCQFSVLDHQRWHRRRHFLSLVLKLNAFISCKTCFEYSLCTLRWQIILSIWNNWGFIWSSYWTSVIALVEYASNRPLLWWVSKAFFSEQLSLTLLDNDLLLSFRKVLWIYHRNHPHIIPLPYSFLLTCTTTTWMGWTWGHLQHGQKICHHLVRSRRYR